MTRVKLLVALYPVLMRMALAFMLLVNWFRNWWDGIRRFLRWWRLR